MSALDPHNNRCRRRRDSENATIVMDCSDLHGLQCGMRSVK